jgi:hypothetical protein
MTSNNSHYEGKIIGGGRECECGRVQIGETTPHHKNNVVHFLKFCPINYPSRFICCPDI